MLFNSVDFLIFFPIVVLIYFLIPKKLKNIWLLLASYYFYMGWNPKYALLILFSTVVTYISGLLIDRAERCAADEKRKILLKKLCVAGSFVINLSILFVFKYAAWIFGMIEKAAALVHIGIKAPVFDLLLPVGISFYTFQALGYTVDVYRGDIRAEKNFIQYALFVSFFPQLVAGPIERSKNLLTQLAEPKRFRFENLYDGLLMMIWGYFLKVFLADRLCIFVDQIFNSSDLPGLPGGVCLVAAVFFTFQIYCDFAGYSCIAMGAAKILGIELMENFRAPFLSQSIAEHWRRWHISLSTWFRDYLYIPLGGNRKGKLRKHINTFIVFFVSGLWHGASVHFVIWGVLQAVYQSIGELLLPLRKRTIKILHLNTESLSHRSFRVVFTFSLTCFAFIFFRADSMGRALIILKNIFFDHTPWVFFDGSLYNYGLNRANFSLALVGLLVLFAADLLKYNHIVVRDIIKKQDWWFQIGVIVFSVWFIVIFGSWGSSLAGGAFIYFQF